MHTVYIKSLHTLVSMLDKHGVFTRVCRLNIGTVGVDRKYKVDNPFFLCVR